MKRSAACEAKARATQPMGSGWNPCPLLPYRLPVMVHSLLASGLRAPLPSNGQHFVPFILYCIYQRGGGGGAQHQREEKLQLWLPPRLPVPDWKMVFLYTLSIQKLLLSARYRHLRVKKLCVDILYPHSELSFPPLPSSLCLLLPLAQSLQFLPGLLKAISGCKVYGFLPPRVSHLGISYFK